MSDAAGRQGLATSLKGMAATLLAMLQTRAELLANELEAEKLRLLRMLLLAQALVFSALLAVVLTIALLTAWLWEFRLAVLLLALALVALCGWLCWRALSTQLQRRESAFASSLDELRRDLQHLRSASGHAATPD